ncbi:MAG: ferritin-like domain-containing protein [Roseiarcus sp.]
MTDGADARDTLNSIYATGLRNAHAMEAQAKELLKRQIERLDDYPELKSRLQQHLSETDRQQDRLERILGSLGESTSSIKDAALALFGNMAAAAHMPARDEVLKDSFASAAFENYEIAAYTSLIDLAEFAGSTDAIPLLRQSCEEEQAMADFLASSLHNVTRQFVAQTTGVAPAAI